MEFNSFQHTATEFRIRLDPRTKLLLLLVISALMIGGRITGGASHVRIVLAFIPFILLVTGRRLKEGLSYALLYVSAWMAEVHLVYGTVGIVNVLVVMFTSVISRFIPCALLGYYVMATTRVSEFIAAMERMRVSQKIVIPLSVMFRFFPTIAEESRSIGDAMRMRAKGMRTVPGGPVTLLEYRMIPMMMSVVRIGEELSAAALSRGLGSPVKRTNICKIGFGFWDLFFLLYAAGGTVFHYLR